MIRTALYRSRLLPFADMGPWPGLLALIRSFADAAAEALKSLQFFIAAEAAIPGFDGWASHVSCFAATFRFLTGPLF